MFAPLLLFLRLLGVTRDLLQPPIEFGQGCGDPLQVIVIEHSQKSGFVAVLEAGPPNAAGEAADK